MQVMATRDSVAAGDDIDAPHARTFDLPAVCDLAQAVQAIVDAGYLPSIRGGQATWSVAAERPLAVVAQQWSAPRLLPGADRAGPADGALALHFAYHGQVDPEATWRDLHHDAADEG